MAKRRISTLYIAGDDPDAVITFKDGSWALTEV